MIGQGGGKICYSATGKLNEAGNVLKIPKALFPSGIARFTLFAATGEPVNERIVFINRPDDLKLTLNAAGESYADNGKAKIVIDAETYTSRPAIAALSAAVINESKVPTDENVESTIFSELLLSSELPSRITNPGHYLAANDEKTATDLDLLMLTQGYRDFEWKKILDTTKHALKYPVQDGLTISGTVLTLKGQPVAKAKVTAVFPFLHISTDTTTDVNGKFTFAGFDVTGHAKIIVKAVTASNETNIKPTLDQPQQTVATTPGMLPVNDLSAAKAMRQRYTDDKEAGMLATSKMLKEVKIKEAYNPDRNKPDLTTSANLNGPGQADQVVMGKDLMGCPTLATCLIGKLHTVTFKDDSIYDISRSNASRIGGAKPMSISLNGAQISQLSDINPNDIYSIEILTSVKYKAIYGHDAAGGLLIITTKRGIPANEVIPREKAPGIITFTYNGYYKARTFYQPKYDAADPASQPSAIYWNPDIITDKDGKAHFEYNNLGKGNYRVVVEGIDGEGRLGRAVYRYKVE